MNTACHCDEECDSYGDCCYDAAHVRPMGKNNIDDEEFERNSMACLPLRFKDNDYKLDEKVTLSVLALSQALKCIHKFHVIMSCVADLSTTFIFPL